MLGTRTLEGRSSSSILRLGLLAAAASLTCLAFVACSASSDNSSGFGGGLGAGGGAGTGSSGTASGSSGTLFEGDAASDGSGNGGGSAINPDAACATSSAEATLVPVNMFIMFDKSGSMGQNGKWTNTTAALKAFFADPASAGLRVALRFFPDAGCDGNACSIDVCSQPAVPLAPLTASPAPADTQEQALTDAVNARSPGGNTPMSAALGGAEKWATDYATAHPAEKVVVILVTDGTPNGCDNSIANIAAEAAASKASNGVLTYAVGLVGSNQAQMDQIATAGGTAPAILIGNGNAEADLVAALKAIQGSQVACDFAMPQGTPAMPVDPKLVNVDYTPGGGMQQILGEVTGAAACGPGGGWYYDNPASPAKITLCPATCGVVQADQMAKIQILLGCASMVAPK